MFDFGLYTQVSDAGPHGPLVLLFLINHMVSYKHTTNKALDCQIDMYMEVLIMNEIHSGLQILPEI